MISKRQYMNYQSSTNLQFEKIIRNAFHSKDTTGILQPSDTTGEKSPPESEGISRVVLLFRKVSGNQFLFILHTKWLLKVQLISLFFVDMQDSLEEVLVLLHKLLGELQFSLIKKCSPSCKEHRSKNIWNCCSRDWRSCQRTKKTENICKRCWNKNRSKIVGRWNKEIQA